MDLAHCQRNPLFGLFPREDAYFGIGRENHSIKSRQILFTLVFYRKRAFEWKCAEARCSGALSIKPFEGRRWRLRRTRPYGI
jgi:hypothetical protein